MSMQQTKDIWWGIITSLLLLALIAMAAYCLKTRQTLDGVALIIGGLSMKLGTLIDFRYGSSAGSKEKTELLAKQDKV